MSESPPHQAFEYRVVPAPRKGERANGVRTSEGRLALTLSRLFNHMGAEGWEFVRSDSLPAEERVGLTGTETRYHALLVFRRSLEPPEPTVVQPAIEQQVRPLLLTQRAPEWEGFEDRDIQEAEIIDILASRLRSASHAAE